MSILRKLFGRQKSISNELLEKIKDHPEEAIQDLCELLKFEINMSYETDPDRILEVADYVLKGMAEFWHHFLAYDYIFELFKENNVNIRLCAANALWRIGPSAIGLLYKAEAMEKDELVLRKIHNYINNLRLRHDYL